MSRGLQPFQTSEYLTRGIVQKLEIECSSNTQVVIATASAAGADDGSVVMEADADITLDITTTGVNGRDAGSEAPNMWYYIHMIRNPSNGLVRGLLSTSVTAPTMPTGYTQRRLVGAVRNNGSSNFIQFMQVIDVVQFYTDYLLVSVPVASSTSWTALATSSYVPPGFGRMFRGRCASELTSVTAHYVRVKPGTWAGLGSGGMQITGLQQPLGIGTDQFISCEFVVDENGVFSWYSNVNSQDANIYCSGYRIEF